MTMCRETLGPTSYSLRWLQHSIQQVHNTSTAHRRQSRNRCHLHRRCEVDDFEGCLPFERRQQTELHRHVESLPAAYWMPHRTRGGGCRPVDCANSSAIGSYEEHCPRGRRYRSGHPAMLPTQIHMASTCSCCVRHGGTTKKNCIWDIKVTQSADICNNILVIHAILVCDTTSRLYGLGKGLSLKRFTSSALFRDKAEQFCKKDATVDDVIDAGEAALVCLYSGNEGENIDGLRYAK